MCVTLIVLSGALYRQFDYICAEQRIIDNIIFIIMSNRHLQKDIFFYYTFWNVYKFVYLYTLRVNLQLNDKSRNTDVSSTGPTKTFNQCLNCGRTWGDGVRLLFSLFLAYPFYLFETERWKRNIWCNEFVNHQFFLMHNIPTYNL
jgi:hypothetical protein